MKNKSKIMKTVDEILDEWYPTIPDEEHNGLYARDKVKLIAQEFADQFRQPAVISSVCMCEMPAKMKGKNQCWRCKKPFKELLQTDC